ncbi:MAG: penicillin-binding protein activator [Gammaproteobacteria bacterium]|nr:penicillin-binding protein activator [Gammaproteobacteria bacterium]
MSKLYQFTTIFIIILFVTGCGGSTTIKNDSKKDGHSSQYGNTGTLDSAAISAMTTDDKIKYSESLFNSALSQNNKQSKKNDLFSNALLLTTQILTDFQQSKLSHEQGLSDISQAQFDYALELTNKMMGQFTNSQLSHEQSNQYLLTSAAINSTNFQTEAALAQLSVDFSSKQNAQSSLYYQLKAMAEYQQGQPSNAVKELIRRHDFLANENEKQLNNNLIWGYLAAINLNEPNTSSTAYNSSISEDQGTYSAWVNLAKILRDSKDPQTMNSAVNFWLQTYPTHQADRTFINHIIQVRQTSMLDVRHIAVLLPQQGKLAKPAKAIRDGIMASHFQSSLANNLQLHFYDTSSDHIWLTYQQAIDDGADFVIGPLAKSNLEVLADSSELTTPTLALNSLEPGMVNAHKPAHLFQFGLSPEASARMVAQKARHQDGHFYAAVMAPDNHWGQRMKEAFSAYWKQSGGIIVDSVDYDSAAHDFSDPIKSMLNITASESRKKEVSRTIGRKLEFTPRRRQDVDMLFMAAFPRQAKQIPLQVIYHHGETIPVYSTSHMVANYQNARANVDMDGVSFSDMPFLLGATQDSTSLQNTYQSTLYQRLFAMGVDSYQLAPYVEYLYKNPSESFSGDTGTITINNSGHVIRAQPWAVFEQGIIKLETPSLNQDTPLHTNSKLTNLSSNF